MYINFRRTKEKCVFLFLIRVPADGPFFRGRFGRIILMVCFCFVELYYSAFSQATSGVSKTGSSAAAAGDGGCSTDGCGGPAAMRRHQVVR